MSKVVKRPASDVIFTALNPEFLRRMAAIAGNSRDRHGTWDNYTAERYDEDRSCVSHAIDHLMHYLSNDKFDRFDGDVRWHLVAAAYNCMMHFYYHGKFGAEPSPWTDSEEVDDECKPRRAKVVPPPKTGGAIPVVLDGGPRPWRGGRK
jgi:hypothetical protein